MFIRMFNTWEQLPSLFQTFLPLMTLKLSPQFFFILSPCFPYLHVQVTNGDNRFWNWSSIERVIFWLKTRLSPAASLMSVLLFTPLLTFYHRTWLIWTKPELVIVRKSVATNEEFIFVPVEFLIKCVSQQQKYFFCEWRQCLWWDQWWLTVVKQSESLKETYYAHFQTHNCIWVSLE